MTQVSLTQAAERLADLVAAAVEGEDVVVVREDNRAVRLVPVPAFGSEKPTFGSARGLISMSDDFDAPLDDFREYTK